MAKLADTMLGYSCCHNSSYLASDVKKDKVLLWAYTKPLHIMSLVHKEEGRKATFFSGQPHCDSKWRCLSKEVKTISDWQAMKTTEGDGKEAQDSCKKCNSNFGKVRWSKPEKRRAKSSWKANCPFVPQRSRSLTATLWEAPRVDHSLKKASCVPKGLSVTGWLLLKIRSSWVWWGDTCLYVYFLCESIHITERKVLPLAKILASLFFFLQKEAEEPALPHRWFPIKIINNNVGTLFLERRFVSVPKWANRGKISCYTLRKK